MKQYLIIGFLALLVTTAAFGFGAKSSDGEKVTPKSESPGALAASQDSIWIVRSDGAKSCSPETAQTIESGAQELIKAKIRVLNSMKGDDGKMRMQMCGAPTGALNAYLIPKAAFGQAIALGYKEAPAKLNKQKAVK